MKNVSISSKHLHQQDPIQVQPKGPTAIIQDQTRTLLALEK
jgi:hypothetical protein